MSRSFFYLGQLSFMINNVFSYEKLGQSKPNFMWIILRKGESKFVFGPGHMYKMVRMPVYGKIFFLQNLWTDSMKLVRSIGDSRSMLFFLDQHDRSHRHLSKTKPQLSVLWTIGHLFFFTQLLFHL